MIYYDRRRFGFRIRELWFAENRSIADEKKCDVVLYHDLKNPIDDQQNIIKKRDACTLVSDLTLSENDIIQKFSSEVRYKVKRAKREGTICEMYTSDDLIDNLNLINQFDNAYKDMLIKKNMKMVSVKEDIMKFAKRNMLYFSLCKIQNNICAYHIYITDKDIIRLLYSVSVFRDIEDNSLKAEIARGNRLLHYEDMLYFKALGIRTYDWGGFSKLPELQNINNFKIGFGGEVTERFNYRITCSIKGNIGIKFKKSIEAISG